MVAMKVRGPQAKPTKAEISAAWARLRQAAELGDIEANALLIALAENKTVIALGAGSQVLDGSAL